MRRLAELTPYPHGASELGRRFLEAHGFQVACLHTMAAMAEGVQGIYRLHPERVYREVKTALHGHQVDGIFLSGTGVHSLDIIPLLEADLGLPVVSSNTAVLWSVLRRLGITPLPGGGRLMQHACRGDAHVEA
jgi:maleate cis-trans isomerase